MKVFVLTVTSALFLASSTERQVHLHSWMPKNMKKIPMKSRIVCFVLTNVENKNRCDLVVN